MTESLRVASWNIENAEGDDARNLGALLAGLGGADLCLLQEATPGGLPTFCDAAGLDWWVHVRQIGSELLSARRRGRFRMVAMAGRGEPVANVELFPQMPHPEKAMRGRVVVGSSSVEFVTFHAPHGGNGTEKPEQAVHLAEWLQGIDGPVILGGDFNTPATDPPDFTKVVTHWHTGHPDLGDAPGDDVLVGAEPVHGLRDAYRTYLEEHPAQLAAIAAARPDGPLATSFCPGGLRDRPHRYDAIWLSPHFAVHDVQYVYEAAVDPGWTDHGLVLVDAELKESAL